MRAHRIAFALLFASTAGLVVAADPKEPYFLADERSIENAIADSPGDYIAGVITIAKPCEVKTDDRCYDRVRIAELVSSNQPGRSRSVGDTFLLAAGWHCGGGDSVEGPRRYLLLAVPYPSEGREVYGAKMMGDAPTTPQVEEFASAVKKVLQRRHG